MNAAPHHVAIIPDGNRRWARAHGLAISDGHRLGAERVWTILPTLLDWGVRQVSFFLFSAENWSRSPEEIAMLFRLLTTFFDEAATRAPREEFAPQVIGDLADPRLPGTLRRSAGAIGVRVPEMARWPRVTFAVNYGATGDVLRAANRMLQEPGAGLLAHLCTAGLAPVDLLVRTGGEHRLSNFLLLEAAYAELAFVDELWPDLSLERLKRVLEWYGGRQRRFGGDPVTYPALEPVG